MSPSPCNHKCEGHDSRHVHGPKCGHRAVMHDGHTDYVVGDHRHYVHVAASERRRNVTAHCDDHGKI